MAYDNTIKKFLGQGLASARPASLNLEPGALGVWVSTDTGAISYWYGGAWNDPPAPVFTPSIQSLTSASTITPVATNDLVAVSALAVNATIANPTGTAEAGQGFVITIKDNGTARTLTWGSNYVGMDGAPVATTTAGKLVDIPVRYSAILSKWLVYKPSVQA